MYVICASICIYVKYQIVNVRYRSDTWQENHERNSFLLIASSVTLVFSFIIAKYFYGRNMMFIRALIFLQGLCDVALNVIRLIIEPENFASANKVKKMEDGGND